MATMSALAEKNKVTSILWAEMPPLRNWAKPETSGPVWGYQAIIR